jgi:predicted CXXCH cytochrome family protein
MSRLLVLLAIGGATVYAAPFSHQLHLKLKPDCGSCHSAAATSTTPQDNLLPEQKACLPCHQNAEIGAPSTTRLAHFSHQQHLKMGNIAPIIAAAIDKSQYLQPPGDTRAHLNGTNPCQACHRGLEESRQVGAVNMPRMADCIVCHTQIDNPFSCDKCHSKGDNLKPASHVQGFMSAHSSGTLNLDKASCTICHGTNFRCLGCH